VAPTVPLYGVLPPHYGRSTHRSARGHWDYDLRLRPIEIAHMKRWGPARGKSVTLAAIEGGTHDLTLSKPAAREQVFASLFQWAEAVTQTLTH